MVSKKCSFRTEELRICPGEAFALARREAALGRGRRLRVAQRGHTRDWPLPARPRVARSVSAECEYKISRRQQQ